MIPVRLSTTWTSGANPASRLFSRTAPTWRLARRSPKILVVGLFWSSAPGHYHVWVWFLEPLDQKRHDEILARHEKYAGKSGRARMGLRMPQFQDKDTRRAREGRGDQFRAPWSRKHGVQRVCLRWHCPDPNLLVWLGEETRPAAIDLTPTFGLKGRSFGRVLGRFARETESETRTGAKWRVRNPIVKRPN